MDHLKLLEEALESAQIELATAEVGLLEAKSRAEFARESVARYEAAVAALKSPLAPPPAAEPSPPPKKAEKPVNNDPLAQVKCAGCGTKGSLRETYMTAPNGSPVRMLECGNCGNQLLQ